MCHSLISTIKYDCILKRQGMAVMYNMQQKGSDSDSESDGFDVEAYRRQKLATQSYSQTLEKRHIQTDSKRTLKRGQDPLLTSMYENILREGDRLGGTQGSRELAGEEVSEYDPRVVSGKVEDPHVAKIKELKELGVDEDGYCILFRLTDCMQVLIVGKIGYMPMAGINANLYLPRRMADQLSAKTNRLVPDDMTAIHKGHLVIIRRKVLEPSPDIDSDSSLQYPYLILDPATMLYPTYICSWIDCKRRITLANYIQGESQINQALVYGSTCHRWLEWLAQGLGTVDEWRKDCQETALRLYNSILYDMYLINKKPDDFFQRCKGSLQNITDFYQRHIVQKQPLQVERGRSFLRVEKVVASEYMFRSRFFGLKGKVDLLLTGTYTKNKQETKVFIPMELKTGKRVSDAHKKQVDIYNMLVREEYHSPVLGLLYYSQSDTKIFRGEDPLNAYGIIMLHRNQIAQNIVKLYSSSRIALPSVNDSLAQCHFCEQSTACQIIGKEVQGLGKDVDWPSDSHQSLKSAIQSFTRHEIDYLGKWLNLLHLQELENRRTNADNWRLGVSNFTLPWSQLGGLINQEEGRKIQIELVHKCRSSQQMGALEQCYKSSLKLRLILNPIALIEGCKVLQTGIDAGSRTFSMVLEMNNSTIEFSHTKVNYFYENQIDLDAQIQTFQNGFFSIMRGTALSLASGDHPMKPIVLGTQSSEEGEVLEVQSKHLQSELEGLNTDQIRAFKKAVSEPQFCLIEGMPGTGKTELILRMVQSFSKMGHKVLVTTFTNRSLDNILERLVESERVPPEHIIREGAQYSCSKELDKFTSRGRKFKTVEEYGEFFGSKRIWLVTLNSLYIHHLPSEFDVVILDEASQCLEPLCLQGVLKGRKLVMIGDYKQLQPVVKSKEAAAKGMSVSLFERLCKSYPSHMTSLAKQYRMNNQIMALSNKLVYNDELQLAEKNLARKRLPVPSQWTTLLGRMNVFQLIINPHAPIVFINHDPIMSSVPSRYQQNEPQIRKIVQTQLPAFLFGLLMQLKIKPSAVSIIAALNLSVNRIVELLRKSCAIQQNKGSVLTIDKSQGIDKQAIILLIEKGNQQLIDNPRRLNVALTRAKSKLIVVGSQEHLLRMKVWGGSLGTLLQRYQVDLSKAMIEAMIAFFGVKRQVITIK